MFAWREYGKPPYRDLSLNLSVIDNLVYCESGLFDHVATKVVRATNPRNPITDTAAVVELCNMLGKDPYTSHITTKSLATKVQSVQEWEALQALNLLDTCMKHCGPVFHAEVGKFRFLNEMIKLVSPKYLGNRTPTHVRHRVLSLMLAWTAEYPKETKIREAYDMLKKQGVVKDDQPMLHSGASADIPLALPPRPKSSIFEDEERSRLLQKLLQSKNPDDLQAANRLIKTMVKEDERRVEQNSRRLTELESVHNNVRLLSEMLDSYRVGQSSVEELDLIKELHQSCERLRPNVFRLASETQESEALLNEVLNVSDELGQVFDKYTAVIIHGKTLDPVFEPETGQSATSLLDLSTPSEERLPPVPTTLLNNQLADLGLSDKQSFSQPPASMPASKQSSNFEALGDIFQSLTPKISPGNAFPLGGPTILQPVSLTQAASNGVTSPVPSEVQVKPDKLKAFKDLDALGESMLKQNLPTSCKLGSQFAKPPSKVPMNLLSRLPESAPEPSKVVNSGPSSLSSGLSKTPAPTSDLYLDFLVGGPTKTEGGGGSSSGGSDLLNGDDSMVDLSEDVLEEPSANKTLTKDDQAAVLRTPVTKEVVDTNVNSSGNNTVPPSPAKKLEVKPLADIFVHLESIKPGNIPPLTVLDEKNCISVVLHFAKERPRQDVSVIVVTTLSKNSSPLTNYLFQAVVPKTCKLRLQPPSGCDLPAYNPFLPPAAITQVLLIANPNKDPVSLKFMVSYLMEDETVTEMGEVEKLPLES
uniref:ADP-ribosylation factor-binding protein GGA1 n=1 Tax=Timema shepardi TaxID=629360 RepID=A0A7R9AN62_TIMSH|nr:unnamed protein product [Timema shepardi]